MPVGAALRMLAYWTGKRQLESKWPTLKAFVRICVKSSDQLVQRMLCECLNVLSGLPADSDV